MTDKTLFFCVKPRANEFNIVGQQLSTLLDVTCTCNCMLLLVACCWELLHRVWNWSKFCSLITEVGGHVCALHIVSKVLRVMHPSLDGLHVPTLLHPFSHHCQHGHNNSQRCGPNNVNSCCVSLHWLHPQSLIWIIIFENKDFCSVFQLKNIHVHARVASYSYQFYPSTGEIAK